jgi:micrococcal nuclease
VLRALALCLALLVGAAPAVAQAPSGLEGIVVRVVDGDTVHVRIGDRTETVRYIGIDTPELHHPRRGEEPGGRAALAMNRRLVEERRVRLDLDVQIRDRYGRLLAYVYRDGLFVNAALVERGYARTLTIPPNVAHAEEFTRLARDAREAGRGLWGACGR